VDAGQRPSHCHLSLLSCDCCSAFAELTRLYNPARCLIDPWRASSACTDRKLLLVGGMSSGAGAGYVDGVGTSAGIGFARGLALVHILLSCFCLFAICSLFFAPNAQCMKPVDYSSRCARAVDCVLIASVQDPLTQDLLVADRLNHNIRKYTRSTGMETANPRVF
jgi:hypothetical protein